MRFAYAAQLILRRLPVVLACAALGLLAGLLLGMRTTTYSTTAYVTLLPPPADQSLWAVAPQRYFATESQLVMSDQVLAKAAQAVPNSSVSQLRADLGVEGGVDSDVAHITATAPSADRSRAELDAVLNTLSQAKLSSVRATMLWKGEPVRNGSPLMTAAEGAAAGLAVSALAVLLWGAVRRPVLTPRDLAVNGQQLTTYPLLVDADTDSYAEAASWALRSTVQPIERVVVLDAGASAGAQQRLMSSMAQLAPEVRVAGSLAQAGRMAGGAGSRLVLVATRGREQEVALERLANAMPDTGDVVAVVAAADQHSTRRGRADHDPASSDEGMTDAPHPQRA